tara:strand:- start:8233 stop:9144 length:912 start_codon:yes stop_codon:yes gene_type:complete
MNIDELDLDYRLLRLFLMIYDEGSVTGAANRLGVGQPTVSHGLDRLRQIVGDPLFVRSGRGITPTAHADEMVERVRVVLQDLRNLARVDGFDPHDSNQSARFVIGTNDYEVAVILPELVRIVRGCAADIRLKVLPVHGDGDVIDRLRNGQLDLAIGLHMIENVGDIAQQTLFREHMACFYDADYHDVAPDTLDRYCAVPHARVIIGNNDHSAVDDALQAIGRKRKTVLQASTFASIASLIRGTDVIASLPSRLERHVMAGFAKCAFPVEFPEYSFAQAWHVRNAASAPHKWLRGEIFKISRRL